MGQTPKETDPARNVPNLATITEITHLPSLAEDISMTYGYI